MVKTDEEKLEEIVKNNQVLRENFNTTVDPDYNGSWVGIRAKQNFPCPLYLFLDKVQKDKKERFAFSFIIPNVIPREAIISSVPKEWWIGKEEGNLIEKFYEKLVFEVYCKYDGGKNNKQGFIVTDKQKEKFLDKKENKKTECYLSFYMKGENPDFAKSWEKFNKACKDFKPLGDLMEKATIANKKQILLNKKNVILQGAPGTGKTYSTAALALAILVPPKVNLDFFRKANKRICQVNRCFQ